MFAMAVIPWSVMFGAVVKAAASSETHEACVANAPHARTCKDELDQRPLSQCGIGEHRDFIVLHGFS